MKIYGNKVLLFLSLLFSSHTVPLSTIYLMLVNHYAMYKNLSIKTMILNSLFALFAIILLTFQDKNLFKNYEAYKEDIHKIDKVYVYHLDIHVNLIVIAIVSAIEIMHTFFEGTSIFILVAFIIFVMCLVYNLVSMKHKDTLYDNTKFRSNVSVLYKRDVIKEHM